MAQYSFDKYSLKVWATKNKGDIKLLLVSLISIATYFSSNSTKPVAVAIAGIVGILCKLGIDAVDYYLSE